jgi:hypothetical protein
LKIKSEYCSNLKFQTSGLPKGTGDSSAMQESTIINLSWKRTIFRKNYLKEVSGNTCIITIPIYDRSEGKKFKCVMTVFKDWLPISGTYLFKWPAYLMRSKGHGHVIAWEPTAAVENTEQLQHEPPTILHSLQHLSHPCSLRLHWEVKFRVLFLTYVQIMLLIQIFIRHLLCAQHC